MQYIHDDAKSVPAQEVLCLYIENCKRKGASKGCPIRLRGSGKQPGLQEPERDGVTAETTGFSATAGGRVVGPDVPA